MQGILNKYTPDGQGGNLRDSSPEEDQEKITSLEQQVEELKFYQELESNEFTSVKQKLKKYENRTLAAEKQKKKEAKKKAEEGKQKYRSVRTLEVEREREREKDAKEEREMAKTKTREKMKQEERDRMVKIMQEQNAKLEKKKEQKVKESQAQIKHLQEKLDELTFCRQLELKEIKVANKKLKEQELHFRNIKQEGEDRFEEINLQFNDKMDKLAKQLQKMKKRQDNTLQEKESLLEEKEEFKKSSTRELQDIKEKHAEELKRMEVALRKAEERINFAKENGRKEVEKANDSADKRVEQLEKNVSNEWNKKVKEMEDKVELMKQIALEERAQFSDEVKELKRKNENALEKVMENYKFDKRQHDGTLAEVDKRLKDSIQMKENKIDELENMLQIKEVEQQETKSQLDADRGALQEKEKEIEMLKEKLSTTEKSVTLFRERARTEMDAIKAAVHDNKDHHVECLVEKEKEKLKIMGEVKVLKVKLSKSEKEVETTSAGQSKTMGMLKAKLIELENAKEQVAKFNEMHQKGLKAKDVQYARDKKKWSMVEQKLREELSELKISSSYQRDSQESEVELRAMVEKLKSEKSALQLKMIAVEDKSSQRIEKELHELTSFTSHTNVDHLVLSGDSNFNVKSAKSKYLKSSNLTSSRDRKVIKDDREPKGTNRNQKVPNTDKRNRSNDFIIARKDSSELISKCRSSSISLSGEETDTRNSLRRYIRQRKFNTQNPTE